MKLLRLLCLVLVTMVPVGALAAGGLVALQAADSSCANDTGNIYVDCGNGTVTDNRTGLVWLKNANCLGTVDWFTAMDFVAGLSDQSASIGNDCGLSDHSAPGEWRLPSATEWEVMVSAGVALGCTPTITNDLGNFCWHQDHAVYCSFGCSFDYIQSDFYWSSTSFTNIVGLTHAYVVSLDLIILPIVPWKHKDTQFRVWPVRGGQ